MSCSVLFTYLQRIPFAPVRQALPTVLMKVVSFICDAFYLDPLCNVHLDQGFLAFFSKSPLFSEPILHSPPQN